MKNRKPMATRKGNYLRRKTRLTRSIISDQTEPQYHCKQLSESEAITLAKTLAKK